MNFQPFAGLLFIALLAGCGAASEGNAPAGAGAGSGTPTPTGLAGTAGSDLEGIVLRFAAGGRVDAFCTPEWSIANQTAVDIPGLLIEIAWHGMEGEVLQAAGEFGTLQEGLSPGRRVDKTLVGHVTACSDLRIVLGTYACRNENAVRIPCPGPVHLLTEGGVQGDTSALQEGRMRGAMEP